MVRMLLLMLAMFSTSVWFLALPRPHGQPNAHVPA